MPTFPLGRGTLPPQTLPLGVCGTSIRGAICGASVLHIIYAMTNFSLKFPVLSRTFYKQVQLFYEMIANDHGAYGVCYTFKAGCRHI